ncbi:MAG: MFS transporter [Haloarculaceae archaeon]
MTTDVVHRSQAVVGEAPDVAGPWNRWKSEIINAELPIHERMAETATVREEERLLTSDSGRVANLLAVGSFLVFLGRSVIPPLLPSVVDDLSLTTSQAGLVMTVLWLSYALLHYPGGRLSDTLTRKTLIVSSLGVTLVGFVWLVFVRSYVGLLAGVALVGAGQGVFLPSSRGLVADLFVHRRSQALGIQIGASSAGSALAAGLAVVALSVATWQASFLPTLAGLVVVVVLIHRWGRESYRVRRVDLEVWETVRRLFTARRMLVLLASYCLFSVVWMGVMSFLPTYLQAEVGTSVTISSAAYALFYVAGIASSPIAGRFGDHVARLPFCAALLGVGLIGLVPLLVSTSIAVTMVGVALLGAGFFGLPPVMQSVLLELFPDDNLAGDFGALKTVYTGVGALGPAYVGFVAQRASYESAFTGFVGCLLVAILGFLVASRLDS